MLRNCFRDALTLIQPYAIQFGFLAMAGCLPTASYSAELSSKEFRFIAFFPDSYLVCPAYSGAHVHGYYVTAPRQKSCEEKIELNRIFSFGIYADANSSFNNSLIDEVPENCKILKDRDNIGGIAVSKIKFKDRDSVVCIIENDKSKTIFSIAYSKLKWPQDMTSTPKFLYTASIIVSRGAEKSGAKQFSEFVTSLKVQ